MKFFVSEKKKTCVTICPLGEPLLNARGGRKIGRRASDGG